MTNKKGSRHDDIKGLILAGGKSSRYGHPKHELNFHGMSQKDYLFRLLGHFCQACYLSAKSAVLPEDKVIIDHYTYEGPLNGILSAFHHFPDHAWLSVACDMPWVGPMVLEHLLAHRNPQKMATCYWDSDGKLPEPLLTLWEPAAFPALLSYHHQEGRSPRAFLKMHPIQCIPTLDNRFLYNVNTKEDHENWKKN